MREKIFPSRTVYKKIQIFPSKQQHSESKSPSQRHGFIMLGNKNRSRSKNKSIEVSQKFQRSVEQRSMPKIEKLKTFSGYDHNPEKDKENKTACNLKVRNSRIKTETSSIWGKQKQELSFTVSLFPGDHKFGYDCEKNRKESRSKSKLKGKQNGKLKRRLEKIKEYDIIEECFSDMELEGIFNELQLSGIPQVRWSLIIIDKAYDVIKHLETKLKSGQITRD